MTELDLDPLVLSDLTTLRQQLTTRIHGTVLPELARTDKAKAIKIDAKLEGLPDSKLIDILIEHHIEKKCV